MATMVRIRPETHQRLQQLAKSSKRTLPDVLDEAISQYEKQRFLADCNAAYARLREDESAWNEELEERALWENTLIDGLEPDEYSKPCAKQKSNLAPRPKTVAKTATVKQ